MKKRMHMVALADLFLGIVVLWIMIYNVNTKEAVMAGKEETIVGEEVKQVALTFDDGPNPCYTEKLLDGLKDREVKATFFLLGKEVEKYPDIVKRIDEEGHLIGNHSFDHVNLAELSEEQACEQITKTNDAIYNVTGKYPGYIRPPFGCIKEGLDKKMNMFITLWDVDTRDWEVQNVGNIEKNVLGKTENGNIILMHDAYATSVTAALDLIDKMKGNGYEFVTVDELIFE